MAAMRLAPTSLPHAVARQEPFSRIKKDLLREMKALTPGAHALPRAVSARARIARLPAAATPPPLPAPPPGSPHATMARR